jgi:hypothetical protein
MLCTLCGQLIAVGHRDVAWIRHHRLAGRVGEVQRVALIGGLELLPVQEHPVGQLVDAPAARRLDQLDRTGIGQLSLGGLEHAHVGQRTELVGAHRDRNPFGAMGFDEHHVVDQQRTTGVVPRIGRRPGQELSRRQVPVGRISGGFEEFAQQHIGIHAGRRLGQVRRRRTLDGADGLWRRCARHTGAARQHDHQRGQQPG